MIPQPNKGTKADQLKIEDRLVKMKWNKTLIMITVFISPSSAYYIQAH